MWNCLCQNDDHWDWWLLFRPFPWFKYIWDVLFFFCFLCRCHQFVYTYRLFHVEGKVWKMEVRDGVSMRSIEPTIKFSHLCLVQFSFVLFFPKGKERLTCLQLHFNTCMSLPLFIKLFKGPVDFVKGLNLLLNIFSKEWAINLISM